MFQSFEVVSNPATGAPRVAKLRAELETLGLDGFLVPRADEHQGEYVPPRAQRLAWLTGFTGSAGVVLVLKNKAHLFVDGRYTLQAADQTDPAVFTVESLVETPPPVWLRNSGRKLTIGFDPWLHTIAETKALREALEANGGKLVAVKDNLVDLVWENQPAPPLEAVTIQPEKYAGKLASDKLKELAEAVEKAKADATVLTDPSSIAWAFNIRGNDVSNTPLPLAFAIIPVSGEPLLFIDKRKLPMETEAYLTQLATLRPPSALEADVAVLGAQGKTLMLDPALAAEKLRLIVEHAGGKIVEGLDPARLPRALKNAAELEGARKSHERDGVAMVSFLAWIDAQAPGSIDEIDAAKKLEETRSSVAEGFQMPLENLSFDSISGAGPNGAFAHYRVNTQSNRKLQDGELYLIDSGGQYRDGTTDITRTLPVGTPTDDMKRKFTLVLKGVIAITTAKFPKGTRGMDIDVLARIALWKQGYDYGHGTGHGVGSFLSVHEGPQSISKRGVHELLPGMILSNEPGYYKPGGYGIRIENLLIVTELEVPEGGDLPMMGFETITFCPIDKRLIDTSLLVKEELVWLDAYHARVREVLLPHTKSADRDWLITATEPFGQLP
ncbi:aminopeptidase P family protein [Phyllobacterium sp. 628]|uniref:aminopeptidase P family protein n=1 Tax=Phyllobacterium sp. 628 TaxID=2718938 RepID=UPI0016624CEC|nr:aminopeptidase P family protein [Phyllobacterium sp. 628]QND53630.1 aminopeptidase P family protein [Phyllobacterium sp. 628]